MVMVSLAFDHDVTASARPKASYVLPLIVPFVLYVVLRASTQNLSVLLFLLVRTY